MPLFFAYGTELDRARLLAKALSESAASSVQAAQRSANESTITPAQPSSMDSAQSPLDMPPQPSGEAAQRPDTSSQPPRTEDSPHAAADTGNATSNASLHTYATTPPIASGYASGMSLVFRKCGDDNDELIADLHASAGCQTWGVLFDLTQETLDAICARFGPAQTCEKRSIHVTKLLSGWKNDPSRPALQPEETVDAICLVSKEPVGQQVEPDEKTLRRLMACYADNEASIDDMAVLLPKNRSSIEALRKDHLDLAERKVCEIYYKAAPRYAIYRSNERVMVQYHDNCSLADKQRADMAPLNSLRSEIAGLIDGFDRSRFRSVADRGKRYNSQVAAALNQRLEGDVDSPKLVLENIRASILAERQSWGRFQYLLSAFCVAVILCLAFWAIKEWMFSSKDTTAALWLAARAGTVGAFFSIASNIQDRKILTDLHMRDNIADSALRVVVGAIGAGVLLSLLQSGLLPLSALGAATSGVKAISWQVILVVGFVAGFSERLVPSIVDKMASNAEGKSPASP